MDYETERLDAYDNAEATRYLMGSIKKPESEMQFRGTPISELEQAGQQVKEDITRVVGGGLRDMAQGAMDLGAELLTEAGEDFLTQSGLTREGAEIQLNIPAPRLPEVAEPKGMIGQIARDFVQFGSGMVVSPGSTIPKAALSDAFFDPEDGGFIKMLRDASLLPEAMNFLAVDVDGESDASKRLKQRLIQSGEGAIIGAVADQVIGTLKRIKDTPDLLRRAGETLARATNATARFADEAGQAADARIAERAQDTGTTLTSGVDPMPAVDAAISAAGRAARRDPNDSAGDAMAQAQARYFDAENFEPPTAENPVSIVPPKPDEPGIIAFHGSGADFDEFRLEMIGTGEGAQAYGYGLYFTDSEDIAKFYRDSLARGRSSIVYEGSAVKNARQTDGLTDRELILDNIATEMAFFDQKPENVIETKIRSLKAQIENPDSAELRLAESDAEAQELADLIRQSAQRDLEIYESLDPSKFTRGKMYKVALAPKPDELLDYDLTIGNQSPDIKAKISKLIDNEITPDDLENFGSPRGDLKASLLSENRTVVSFLNDFSAIRGKDNAAEELLAKYGIPGIKYFDNTSRNTAGGKLIDVTEAEDGFRAKVAVENRTGGLGGSGRIVTTSSPYKTKQEALDWADEATKKSGRNYVIFDDKAIRILEKYGIVGPVVVTAAGVKSAQDDDDKVANASEM